MRRPIVYFIFRVNSGEKSTRFGGFARRLKRFGKMPDAEYKTIALEDLTFCIDWRGNATIYGADFQPVLEDASFVYFKSWEGMPEHSSMIASYLLAKGIPFEDQAVRHVGTHKASQMWRLWSENIPVVPTIVGSNIPSEEVVEKIIGKPPYLIKPIHGEKGRGVEKILSYSELPKDTSALLVQPFIKNEGDYRVMVYGYEVRGALFRRGAEDSVVNNTSQGGSSQFVESSKVEPTVSAIACRSARAVNYAVAGVDVMVGNDDIARVLEVNQGSQIVTGHYIDKKCQAFANFLDEHLTDRYGRSIQNNKLAVIGRYVHVNFPDFGIKQVFAKVDTGAYQSSVHATNIKEIIENGKKYLEFNLLDGHKKVAESKILKCRVDEYEKTFVKSSNGHRQLRYIIKARISINGRMMKTGITLSDRKDMVAPVLLGRRFLRGRYIVNVELSRIQWGRKA